MELSFHVSPEMVYDAQMAVASRIRWMRWAKVWAAGIYPVLIVCLSLLFGSSLSDALRDNAISIVAFPAFFMLGIPLIQRWSAKRLWRATPGLQGELRYVLNDVGVRQISGVSTSDIAWAGFVRATETSQFLLLFPSNAMAHFIPKSALPTTDEQQRARELIINGIGDRAEFSASQVVQGAAR